MTTRIARPLVLALGIMAMLVVVYARRYPADTTPEGAYLRLAKHLELGQPELAFSYLERDARDAVYTMARARTDSLVRVRHSFPAEESRKFAEAYGAIATGDDGPRAFARYAEPRGWTKRLAKDVSPIDHVERDGDRATVVTKKGTRYPFRQDPDGRYGLTSFTAELVLRAKQALSDKAIVERSAADYERQKAAKAP